MIWRKLGRIFNPIDHKLSNGCYEYSQSPQALVFDDFVRIYFSTREVDPVTRKAKSHISFVDMGKDFKRVKRLSRNTVIQLGEPGCFDEHGIFPINVLKENQRILAYTTGWSRRVSVSVDTSIGFAESFDGGVTFQKLGKGPVLTSSLDEPFLVADGFVRRIGDLYYMWYIYGTKWIIEPGKDTAERIYKISSATSSDGVNWAKEGHQLIEDRIGESECQALPTVVHFGGLYHMLFCYRKAIDFRKNKHNGYRIGYAYSPDLKIWTRDDENVGINVSPRGWDSEMLCYPHAFKCNGTVYLLYNGNEFGRYGFGLAKLENGG